MDVLRSCYRTRMHFPGGPAEGIRIRWFFTEKDFLHVPSVYHSHNWRADKEEWPLPGEMPGPRPWVNGADPPARGCAGPSGAPDAWIGEPTTERYRLPVWVVVDPSTGVEFDGGITDEAAMEFASSADIVVSLFMPLTIQLSGGGVIIEDCEVLTLYEDDWLDLDEEGPAEAGVHLNIPDLVRDLGTLSPSPNAVVGLDADGDAELIVATVFGKGLLGVEDAAAGRVAFELGDMAQADALDYTHIEGMPPAPNTLNPGAVPIWVEAVVDYTQCLIAANNVDLEVYSLPAGGVVECIYFWHSVAWTGGTLGVIQASVGKTGSAQYFTSIRSINGAPTATPTKSTATFYLESLTGATSVRLFISTTIGNLNQLTQGRCVVKMLISYPDP